MPRKSKGARLYLRAGRADRDAVWVIKDAGREFSTGCRAGDRDGAERAFARHLAEKYEPAKPKGKIQLEDLLVVDVVNIYLKEHAPTTSSLSFLVHTAAPIIEWWCAEGRKTLADVRKKTCGDYIEWRIVQGRGVSKQTARHDLKTMRAATRYYHESYGPLPSVPVVTLPPKKPTRQDYWLTRKQVADRIRAARRGRQAKHVIRMLLIGVYSGTRPGAILKLRWLPSTSGGWVDLDSKTLHRRGQGTAESKKLQPQARIHNRLQPHLERWKRADAKLSEKMKLEHPITHVVHYYGKPITTKLRRSWDSVAITAGQADRVLDEKGNPAVDKHGNPVWKVNDGPHICRHTAATWLMQSGVDLFEAAGYLGMSPETLWEVYGHHHPTFQENAAAATGKRKT